MDAVSGWMLEYSRLLVLDDFSVHADDASSTLSVDLVSSMVVQGLFQYVMIPTHWAGHMLNLIFAVRIMVDQITVNVVPWSDHHTLRAHVNAHLQSYLDDEPISAHLWSLMDPM